MTALAALEIAPTSDTALQKHLLAAKATAECLDDDLVFQGIDGLRGHTEAEAEAMLEEAGDALARDELHVALAEKLRPLALRAQRWLRGKQPKGGGGGQGPEPGEVVVAQGAASSLDALAHKSTRASKGIALVTKPERVVGDFFEGQ